MKSELSLNNKEDTRNGDHSVYRNPTFKSLSSDDSIEAKLDYPLDRTATADDVNDGRDAKYQNDPTDSDEEECCRNVLPVSAIQQGVREFYQKHHELIWTIVYLVLAVLYFCYFGYAMSYSYGDEGSVRLLVVTVLATAFIIGRIIWSHCGDRTMARLNKARESFKSQTPAQRKRILKIKKWLYKCFMVGYAIFVVVWLIVDVGLNNPENLISAAGIAVFIFLFYLFSYNPAKVKWRPVLWGLYIQFALALIILRWDFGFQAFNWLGRRFNEFLSHSDDGAKFVFGEKFAVHFFAFKVLPVVVFFSAMISILYYFGAMQFIIRHIARAIALPMGTSACETLSSAGNIFVSLTEAPLLIRPFIQDLTRSELHAVLTAGFATMSGSVIAASITYGISASHLITASVMSAPAALAMSKLFYPETKKIIRNDEDVYKMENMVHNNVIAAASEGASASIKLVASVAVNMIAFIGIKHFVNATLTWFGHRVGLFDPELTFELICSYALWPLAYLMGVQAQDCRAVGELIGVKTFINSIVAYSRMGVLLKNRDILEEYNRNMSLVDWENATWTHVGENIYLNATNTTLKGGTMEERSEVIATYALCGLSSIGSVGVAIGIMTAMAPSRKQDITAVVVRAMIAGNVACFITASIAGLLFKPPEDALATNSSTWLP